MEVDEDINVDKILLDENDTKMFWFITFHAKTL